MKKIRQTGKREDNPFEDKEIAEQWIRSVEGEKKKPHRIIQEKCVKCGVCFDQCRFQAVEVR